MDQAIGFRQREQAPVRDGSGLGHPDLLLFDEARKIMASCGLRPEPQVYELLWFHLTGADPALSRDIERAIEEGDGLSPEAIGEIRRAHLGEIAASELHAIMETAHGASGRLADRLQAGLSDIEAYDRSILDEDLKLGEGPGTAGEFVHIIQRLRRANARMLAANRRLQSEIERANRETSALLERLESAERAARTDTLTGLLNRRGLMVELRRAIDRARAERSPLSVALADIDHFKRINDQWGHAIGDEVLRYLGGFLAHCLKAREGSFVGRYGGEEFIAVFPGLDRPAASAAMDAIRAALARQVVRRTSDGARLGRLAFSAGVAGLKPDDSPESLIDRADNAAYAAKRAGRDRVLPEMPDRGV